MRYRSSSEPQSSVLVRDSDAGPALPVCLVGVSSTAGSALSGSAGRRDPWSGDFCGKLGSLSRTCRITSASRFASLCSGADSSTSAARIRAKVFVLGFGRSAHTQYNPRWATRTNKFPRRVTARLITPNGPPPPSECGPRAGLRLRVVRPSPSSLKSDSRRSPAPMLRDSRRG